LILLLEAQLPQGQFVANNLQIQGVQPLDDALEGLSEREATAKTPQALVITGPNMAGKSTYMRQTALIVLMAQMGSFVPAQQATIGLVDAVYTRIGAVDDLSAGQSTFMVEMTETAEILNNATSKTLVILDEIGRGTSTYDGVAIAWSVLAYLVERIGCRTLFATHYHELAIMAEVYGGRVGNRRVVVSELPDGEGGMAFLHRVEAGAAQKSYGVQVAKMAGLPVCVVQEAEQKLNEMNQLAEQQLRSRKASLARLDEASPQLLLF
jgi:DNA mismatch repair protein MutS